MKWTNHERLFTYGVYLVGWPSDIPVKNPSSLKTDQNKRLLELLNNGTLKFMKNILLASGSGSDQVDSVNEDAPVEEVEEENEAEVSDEMFSWAIQYDVDSTPTVSPLTPCTSSHSCSLSRALLIQVAFRPIPPWRSLGFLIRADRGREQSMVNLGVNVFVSTLLKT